MAGERVSRWHSQESAFFPEREREREREKKREEFKRDGAFKSADNFFEGEEKCVLGIYPLLLDTPQWLS